MLEASHQLTTGTAVDLIVVGSWCDVKIVCVECSGKLISHQEFLTDHMQLSMIILPPSAAYSSPRIECIQQFAPLLPATPRRAYVTTPACTQ